MQNRSYFIKAVRALLWTAPFASVLSMLFPARAQVTPTIGGANTQVSQDGDVFDISGGTQAEGNLFHEFESFSVDDGQTANFLSDSGVFNIVGQVSGLSPSYINGLLQVSGSDANLYLVNPAGILFGPNGQLSLSGSFVATTADQIGFGEDWLTVLASDNDYTAFTAAPDAFAFTVDDPSAVVNQGDLAVEAGESLVLMGGNVVSEGRLEAAGGEVGLVAVGGDRTVRLGTPGSLLSLEVVDSGFPAGQGSAFAATDLPTLLTGNGNTGATNLVIQPSGIVRLLAWEIEPEEVAVTREITTRTDTADGGVIALLGNSVDVLSAAIDASGETGGAVRIGRKLDAAENLPGADVVLFDTPSVVRADGLVGAAGDIVIGAQRLANLNGTLSAAGATQGGFVETSADYLNIAELSVDASGQTAGGQWLIDPVAVEIVDAITGFNQVTSASIEDALDNNMDLTIATTAGVGGFGDISLLDSIDQAGMSTGQLTLTGRRFSTNGSTINLASAGGLTFNLNAVNTEAVTSGDAVESAIASIGNVAGDRQITLRDGVYTFSNTVDVNKDVDIVGTSRAGTVLNIDGNARLFSVRPDSEVSLNNLTFGVTTARQGGGIFNQGTLSLNDVSALGNTAAEGGAVQSETNSQLDISNSTFDNNAAFAGGGAIYAENSLLNISSSIFENNLAGGDGGGVLLEDADSALTLENVRFENNRSDRNGGGVASLSGAVVQGTEAIFTGNSAVGSGGSLYIEESIVDFEDSAFNESSAAVGGAIALVNSETLLVQSEIDGNEAITAGGGLYQVSGELSLEETAITNNEAGENGGGVAIGGNAAVTMNGGEISSNQAVDFGGGLHQSDASSVVINSARMVSNDAAYGGGLTVTSNAIAEFFDSLVADNSANIDGGGFYLMDSGVIEVTNATLRDNVSGESGGLAYQFGTSRLTVSSAGVERNQAGAEGGAFAVDGGTLTLSGVGANNNVAGTHGGAIASAGDSTVTVEVAGFDGNEAQTGDGGAIYVGDRATLSVTSSGLQNNVASESGGAIALDSQTTASVASAIIDNNVAGNLGGGLYTTGTTTVDRVALRNNRARTGGGLSAAGDSNLMIADGTVVENNLATSAGGGVAVLNNSQVAIAGSLTLDAEGVAISGTTRIENNEAQTRDGGGLVVRDRAHLDLSGVLVKGNFANNGGGGLHLDGATAEVRASVFERNEAEHGGGIATHLSDLTLRDSKILSNRARVDGGGFRLFGGTATVEATNFTGNGSEYGGGLELSVGAEVSASGSEFSGNEASIRGGGIQVDNTSVLALESSTLANNRTAGEGGGLFSTGTAELVNTTLYGNEAGGDGGAIASGEPTAITTVRNSTISENKSASVGGGIASNGTVGVRLLNTIVAENNGAAANDVSGRFIDEGNNLIGQSNGSTGFTKSTLVGQVGRSVDPALAPLADNGGATRTQLLEQDSMAINAGINNNLPTTDQRGLSRVAGDAVDIGAVELTNAELPDFVLPVPPNPQPSGGSSAGIEAERTNQFDGSGLLDPTLAAEGLGWIAIAGNDDADDDNRTISQLERAFGRSFEDYWDLPLEGAVNFNDVQGILRRAQEEYKVNSAIIYAIFLPEQIGLNTGENAIYVESTAAPDDLLHLALVMPEGELVRYQLPVTREEATRQVSLLRSTISDPEDMASYRPLTKQLYRWLLAPLEEDLEEQGIQNLMYALDTGLRNAPVTAMHDYNGFSLERFGISVVPNMGLTQTDFGPAVKRSTVAMGVSQFETAAPLPAVPIELAVLDSSVSASSTVLNEGTTTNALESVQALDKPGVLHLATHASFDHYSPESSSISMWNRPLSMKEFAELDWLESDLELLILSACSTAISSANAELGFAGLAAASGVDATVGSLWEVSDVGTLALMSEFYAQLERTDLRFEALRRAQLSLLTGKTRIVDGNLLTSRGVVDLPDEWNLPDDATLDHPFFWSAFTMVGNPW